MSSKQNKVRDFLQFVAGILAVLKLIPIPGWRNALIALSALIGVLITAIDKCDVKSDPTPIPAPTTTPQSTPSATPTHMPSPSPTPVPIEIIVPTRIVVKEPFVVRVTAPFAYNINLSVDRFHLCILGQEYKTKFLSCTVTLWTAGKRVLKVTLPSGQTLEKQITVEAQ